MQHAVEIGGDRTRQILGQLREVAVSEQVIGWSARIIRLLLEPTEVSANDLNRVDSMAGADVASVEPLEPRRDVRALNGIEADGLRVEPDVKLTKTRPVGTERCWFECGLERFDEAKGLGWELEVRSRPEASRIEREKLAIAEPIEVAKQTPSMLFARADRLRCKQRR